MQLGAGEVQAANDTPPPVMAKPAPGVLVKLPIDQVRVPERRARQLGDVADLAQSIAQVGLLNPIVVTEDHTLVSGLHRLEACRRLGWTEVPAAMVSLTGLLCELAEIDENLVRNELTALERGEHLARRKDIHEALHPETKHGGDRGNQHTGGKARQDETISFCQEAAGKTGQSPRTIQQEVRIATRLAPQVKEAIRETPLADSKVALVALSRLEPERQQAVAERLVAGEARNVKQALRQVEQAERVTQASAMPERADRRLLQGDAVELLKALEVRPHLVIADPPYGLEVHNTRRGEKDYADGEAYALDLLRRTCAELARVCDPSAHLYFFAGYDAAWPFKQVLAEFFEVQRHPLVWVKDNHTLADFAQEYPSKYEFIWFCRMRGSGRTLARCVPDVIECPRERESTHSAEKPTALLATLVEQSTAPGELVLDPFAGSGATGVAAARLGRSFVGIELDSKWAEVAHARIASV